MKECVEPVVVYEGPLVPHVRFINGPGEDYKIFIDEELKFVMTTESGCIYGLYGLNCAWD